MNDLISRQAAIDTLEREKVYCTAFRDGHTRAHVFEKYNCGLDDGIKALKRLPTAQPEIIRCKDCKHFNRGISCVGGFYDGCDELTDNGNEMPVDEDFYCGYAERKTDE